MNKSLKKKLIIAWAVIGLLIPSVVFAARTDALWDYANGTNFYSPNGSATGVDILIKGSNHYLNWGSTSGINGYGIRDNSGTMEFKNSGGSWTGIGSGGGGTNFFSNSGSNTTLTTGSNLYAGGIQATSVTASSTFNGGFNVIGNLNTVNFGTALAPVTHFNIYSTDPPIFSSPSGIAANQVIGVIDGAEYELTDNEGNFTFGDVSNAYTGLAEQFNLAGQLITGTNLVNNPNVQQIINDGSGRFGIGTSTPGTLISLGSGSTFVNLDPFATSTFGHGINIKAGCYAIAGTCIGTGGGGSGITALTGDVTASGAGSVAATLATVNGNVGSFGGATSIPNFTVNAKGLVTAAGVSTPSIPVGDITGTLPIANGGSGATTNIGGAQAFGVYPIPDNGVGVKNANTVTPSYAGQFGMNRWETSPPQLFVSSSASTGAWFSAVDLPGGISSVGPVNNAVAATYFQDPNLFRTLVAVNGSPAGYARNGDSEFSFISWANGPQNSGTSICPAQMHPLEYTSAFGTASSSLVNTVSACLNLTPWNRDAMIDPGNAQLVYDGNPADIRNLMITADADGPTTGNYANVAFDLQQDSFKGDTRMPIWKNFVFQPADTVYTLTVSGVTTAPVLSTVYIGPKGQTYTIDATALVAGAGPITITSTSTPASSGTMTLAPNNSGTLGSPDASITWSASVAGASWVDGFLYNPKTGNTNLAFASSSQLGLIGPVYDSTGSLGTSGQFLKTTGSATLWATVSGGGGTPATPLNSIQYNNASSFGGISNFLSDGTSPIIAYNGALKINGRGPGNVDTAVNVITASSSIRSFYFAGSGNATESGTGDNIGIGNNSLTNITTGAQNFAAGTNSGAALGTGLNNFAMGFNALSLATSSSDNVAVGVNALRTFHAFNGGGKNTAIGSGAMSETGLGTAANGSDSGTAIGYNSLVNQTSGFSNAALGAQTATSLTTGNNDTFFGTGAGSFTKAVTTGTNSIFLGASTAWNNANFQPSFTTVIGTNSTARCINCIVLGGSEGEPQGQASNIGIGTSSPSARLDILAGPSFYNDILFNISSSTAGFATTSIMTALANGNVGVSTSTPWRTFSVNGTVAMKGLSTGTSKDAVCIDTLTKELVDSGATTCLSSSQYTKHSIQSISDDTAAEVMKLNPVEYVVNDTGITRYGFIAEQLEKIDPKLVDHAAATTTLDNHIFSPGDPYSVDYLTYTGLLTKFVQDEQVQINNLKVSAVKSVQDEWQWMVIILLAAGFGCQQLQIRKLKNKKQ